jgi:2-polyprenyl-6-methoxyphenol hydroxylase-like FAD-dependent oxidoreductase
VLRPSWLQFIGRLEARTTILALHPPIPIIALSPPTYREIAMSFHIGIAGAGVAGLAAATLLSRAGHDVTLHEQAASLGPVGAGVLLQPSGQIILQAMNLLDEVIAHAEPIHRLTAYTHRGKTLINLPYTELSPTTLAYGLRRSELFDVLHAAATNAGTTILTAQRMLRYTKQNDGVYFEDASSTQYGPYDFVLAADGANSCLRKNSPLTSHVHPYPHGALYTTGPCTSIQNRLLQICHGTTHLCGILPTGHQKASLFWGIRNDEKDPLRQQGFSAWHSQVLALCPQAEELLADTTSFDTLQFVSYQHVHMHRPFDESCLFLGDAAHAMSPHLGQGINLALIDAFTFAQALTQHKTFALACRHYTQQRAAHLRAYRIITRLLSPFFQSKGFIKGWGRDFALPLMPRIPYLRKQMLQTMSGQRAGLFGGTWKAISQFAN